MKYLYERTKELVWKSDTLFLELWVSTYSIFLGILFLVGVIDSYYTGAVYSVISVYVPREIWGGALIILGLLQLYGVYTKRYSFQKWACTLATAFWAFTASITAFGNGHTSVSYTNLMILLAQAWLYLRISRKLRIRSEVRGELSNDT